MNQKIFEGFGIAFRAFVGVTDAPATTTTTTASKKGKTIVLKTDFRHACAVCGKPMVAGETITNDGDAKGYFRHVGCGAPITTTAPKTKAPREETPIGTMKLARFSCTCACGKEITGMKGENGSGAGDPIYKVGPKEWVCEHCFEKKAAVHQDELPPF